MTEPKRTGGFIHHYIFEDYYLHDSRTVLLKSEIKYLEKEHGKLMNHWIEPLHKEVKSIYHVCFEDGTHMTWENWEPHGDYIDLLSQLHGKVTLGWEQKIK